ncbi:MAG: DUF885 domain-containing protein [Steroidobacteraceae bacterium]|nr:DUF885 domain-containing protein [Steroidobacteraceae bacterium]
MTSLRPFSVALAAALLTTACAGTPVTTVASVTQPAVSVPAKAETVGELVEAYFDEALALNPTTATFIGDHRYDDRLENTASAAYDAATLDLDRRYLARARAIDPAPLAGQDRLTWDIFVRERERAIAAAAFPRRLLGFSQMGGAYESLALLGSGAGPQPFETVADYERWLERARQFPAWVDSVKDAMREGAAHGVTQPRVVMQKTLPQIAALAEPDLAKNIFMQPVRSFPDGIAAEDRKRLTAGFETLVRDMLVPSLSGLHDFVRDEYLPRARSTVGWSALPDGKAWYAFMVEEMTTTRLSPDEIHALGLAEVARIRGEMEAVMREVGFKGDLTAFFKHVQEDPKFYYQRPEDLLAGYRELKARIDARLPTMFADFPKADYEVRAVEPFRAASAAGASYQGPSQDGKRPGIFYVNTFNLKAQPKFGMETLSLHEASPGHHFQVSIQQELTDLPRVRRFNFYVAYVEGWALYAESIGRELGMFTDPMQYYGRLSDEMLRAIRLVTDTGLHAKGWTREQAIQYFKDNSSMAESDVVAEVERYIVWPGQALGYKVGQLRISAMRRKAEQALGPRFDVKAFHSQVLRDGALPMDVLEAKIDRWIDSQRVAPKN